jgi:amidase
MLDATAGADTGAPYYAAPPPHSYLSEVGSDPGKLHIAFTIEHFLGSTVDEDCVKGFEDTVKLCEDLGHEVEEAAPPVDGKAFAEAFLAIVCVETNAVLEEAQLLLNRKAKFKDFELLTWVISQLGKQYRATKYSRALYMVQRISRVIGEFFEKYDVLLTPTLAAPPLVTGALKPKGLLAVVMKLLAHLNAGGIINRLSSKDALAEQFFSFIPYTPLFNATGQPAMSVPLYWNDEGLPIGMQFVGRYGDEATLFRLAGQLEKTRPWFDRFPPICASIHS